MHRIPRRTYIIRASATSFIGHLFSMSSHRKLLSSIILSPEPRHHGRTMKADHFGQENLFLILLADNTRLTRARRLYAEHSKRTLMQSLSQNQPCLIASDSLPIAFTLSHLMMLEQGQHATMRRDCGQKHEQAGCEVVMI